MSATLPKVTVVTVTYNAEKTLARTLQSLTAQTYPNLELLLIDGKSKDGTLAVAESFHDNRLRIVSEPDKGLYDAMNKGTRLATGDFVMFINAGDELYRPDTLARAFAHWNGEDILYGDTVLTDNQGTILGLRRHKPYPKKLTVNAMRQGMVVCHQSILVRKSIAPEFDPTYKCSADIDWTIRALRPAKGVLNTKLVLSKFELGGFSTQHRRYCWQDRFRLLWKHFGALTLWDHFVMGILAVYRKLVPIPSAFDPARDSGY
jgi:glycosyltransferase involved in cell wall biosynthesis